MSTAASARGKGTGARGVVVFTVGLLAALGLAWYLRELLLLIYASALFAILAMPMVEHVERWHWRGWRPNRGLAMAAVVLCGLGGVALVLLVLLPPLWGEANQMIVRGPWQAAGALGKLQRQAWFPRLDVAQLQAHLAQASGWALIAAQHFASGLTDFFTILLLTIYLIADGEASLAWCLAMVPTGARGRLAEVLDRSQRRVRGWLLGQVTLAALAAGCSVVVFGLLRVPYFYVLALLTGLLTFVPILGPVAAAAVAAAVAASDSWPKMVGVLIFFGCWQILDNAYLTPRVMRNAVNVPGLAIIIALAIGGSVAGILGAALAVPSAALLAEVLREYAAQPPPAPPA